MRHLWIGLLALSCCPGVDAASKPHVISFGKPQEVKLLIGASEDKVLGISVRALYVDTKLKEFTTGQRHDVTDRLFVIRRAFRINDFLPDDAKKRNKWLWQRGGWLLVDRCSGKISALKLPDFDTIYSEVSWYRDYAAYCGMSDAGDGLYALVAEVGSRKPLYRKLLGKIGRGDSLESQCPAPHWQRQPARVTFQALNGEKMTVNVGARFVDGAPDSTPSDEP
jgi:hypothetical protein